MQFPNLLSFLIIFLPFSGTTSYPTHTSRSSAPRSTAATAASNVAAGGLEGADVVGSGVVGAGGGAEVASWTCNHCTFINRGELVSCEICSLPR